jgi:UDP-N-acetylmuramate-alanine ligase
MRERASGNVVSQKNTTTNTNNYCHTSVRIENTIEKLRFVLKTRAKKRIVISTNKHPNTEIK